MDIKEAQRMGIPGLTAPPTPDQVVRALKSLGKPASADLVARMEALCAVGERIADKLEQSSTVDGQDFADLILAVRIFRHGRGS